MQLPDVELLCGARGHLPLLNKLELIILDHPDSILGHEFLPRTVCDLFNDAPLLTHVALREISDWHFNWQSLSILDLDDIPEVDEDTVVFDALRETINSIKLTVGGTFSRDWADVEVSKHEFIHLRHLKYLSLYGTEPLIALEAPALQRLKIEFFGHGDTNLGDAGRIVAFLCRSRPRLDTFVTDRAEGASIKEVLPYMSDIENLIMRRTQGPGDVFKWLGE